MEFIVYFAPFRSSKTVLATVLYRSMIVYMKKNITIRKTNKYYIYYCPIRLISIYSAYVKCMNFCDGDENPKKLIKVL